MGQVPWWVFPAFIAVLVLVGVLVSRHEKKHPEKQEEALRKQQEWKRQRQEQKDGQVIVKTEILSQSAGQTVTRGSMISSMGRAAVGGMLGGTVGAIAGAATGKQTSRHYGKTTFRIYYRDGSTKIETVSDGTPIWKKYMELL